jgi:mono/diheme cytochrome c family protein
MFDQPAVKPQSGTPRGLPAGTVSQHGPALPFAVSFAERAQKVDAVVGANPVAGDATSVSRGKDLFGVYCVVCHGETGQGDGPAALRAPALRPWYPLNSPAAAARSDQYLFGQIWAGGAVMGPYGHALEISEVWDIVNYIRSLQKP